MLTIIWTIRLITQIDITYMVTAQDRQETMELY
jgi:hypothetical protein